MQASERHSISIPLCQRYRQHPNPLTTKAVSMSTSLNFRYPRHLCQQSPCQAAELHLYRFLPFYEAWTNDVVSIRVSKDGPGLRSS